MRDALEHLLDMLSLSRGAEEQESEEESDSDDDDSEDDEDEDEEDEELPGGKKKESDNEALLSALREERKERKRLAKENKQLARGKAAKDTADASEVETARREKAESDAKAEKLAARLRRQAIDMVLTKHAVTHKFRDVGDVLAQVTRDEDDWVDQDDDDPSEIEVDEKAVEDAVKALAQKKKYLLQAEGETEASGSKFGGRGKNKDEMSEDALREKYASMRR